MPDRPGLDEPLVVHDAFQNIRCRPGRERHPAPVGRDQARVADAVRPGPRGFADHHADQIVSLELQRQSASRGKLHAAQRCDDPALVGHRRRRQDDEAPVGGPDRPLVDDGPGRGGRLLKPVIPGQEPVVCDVQGRSHEAGRLDDARGADENALGIGDEHPPVGAEAPVDRCRVAAGDAVEHHGPAAGLRKGDGFPPADVEGAPVQDSLVRRLADAHHGGRRPRDGRLPRDDGAVTGQTQCDGRDQDGRQDRRKGRFLKKSFPIHHEQAFGKGVFFTRAIQIKYRQRCWKH